MKKRVIVGFATIILSTLCFADCPPPESITISSDFKVTPPEGYTYYGEQIPISATGPISLAMVGLLLSHPVTPSRPYRDIPVQETECWYGVGMTSSGTYPKGFFLISKKESFTADLEGQWNWTGGGYEFLCAASRGACTFSAK